MGHLAQAVSYTDGRARCGAGTHWLNCSVYGFSSGLEASPEMPISAVARKWHVLVPWHTPQSSTQGQHTPVTDSGVVQHRPCTSTATPLPLHTPHASSVPLQHWPKMSRIQPSPCL